MGKASRPGRRSDKRRPVRPRWIRRQLARSWTFSILLLAVMVAGTAWLSPMTAQGPSLAQQMEAVGGRRPLFESAPPQVAETRRHDRRTRSGPHPVARTVTHWPAPARLPARQETASSPAEAGMPARYLSPLQMPAESMRLARMRLHHYGRVVLGIRLDPGGGVAGLWLQQSSGDTVLDRYALQRVGNWRFASPPPDEATGLLALRFEAGRH